MRHRPTKVSYTKSQQDLVSGLVVKASRYEIMDLMNDVFCIPKDLCMLKPACAHHTDACDNKLRGAFGQKSHGLSHVADGDTGYFISSFSAFRQDLVKICGILCIAHSNCITLCEGFNFAVRRVFEI